MKMRNEIQKLLSVKEIGQRTVSLLIIGGFAKPKENVSNKRELRYSQIELTQKGREAIGQAVEITDDFIEEFRKGFPPGKRSTPGLIRNKMERFRLQNPDYTDEEIIEAKDKYLRMLSEEKYSEKASNFIFREEKFGGERSTLLEYLLLEDEEEDSDGTVYGGELK